MPNNVIILKQLEEGFSKNGKPVNGIVRVEKEDDTTTLSLSLLNYTANKNVLQVVLFFVGFFWNNSDFFYI